LLEMRAGTHCFEIVSENVVNPVLTLACTSDIVRQ
jgi:hypothetical protein